VDTGAPSTATASRHETDRRGSRSSWRAFFAASPRHRPERFGDLLRPLPRRGADGPTAVELTARASRRRLARPRDRGGGSGAGATTPPSWRRSSGAAGRASPGFDDLFFPGDAKEAVAFALLGYLTLHGQPGNVPAATGARGARVLGTVTPA
jgi:hypothetical protein